MDEPADGSLLTLLTWFSPAFPVGSFAYSHGVERAIHDEAITDRASLGVWLSYLIEQGSGWNDAVLLAEAWRNAEAGGDCREVAELAVAMAGSRERHMETTLQGGAFADAIANRGDVQGMSALSDSPYPVGVGRAAALKGIELRPVLTAYLHAFASNLIQAAMRLVPLGQRDGVAAMAALEPVIREVALRAANSTLDDLGSATFMSEIAAMKHETQYSRVFRS